MITANDWRKCFSNIIRRAPEQPVVSIESADISASVELGCARQLERLRESVFGNLIEIPGHSWGKIRELLDRTLGWDFV